MVLGGPNPRPCRDRVVSPGALTGYLFRASRGSAARRTMTTLGVIAHNQKTLGDGLGALRTA